VLKISHAGSLGLSPAISAQFTLDCGPQPEILKNSLKPAIFGVHGHSGSSMLTLLRSLSPVLVMISSMSVPICNHLHAKRANTCKITSFKRGCALLSPPHSWRLPSLNGMKFCHEVLETLSCHMVKTQSLYLTCA